MKELIENSIDAESNAKNRNHTRRKRPYKGHDNGIGMEKDAYVPPASYHKQTKERRRPV